MPEGSDALFSRNTKRRTTKPVKKERKKKSFLKRAKSVSWITITNVFVLDVIPLITIIISIAVVVWFFSSFLAHSLPTIAWCGLKTFSRPETEQSICSIT